MPSACRACAADSGSGFRDFMEPNPDEQRRRTPAASERGPSHGLLMGLSSDAHRAAALSARQRAEQAHRGATAEQERLTAAVHRAAITVGEADDDLHRSRRSVRRLKNRADDAHAELSEAMEAEHKARTCRRTSTMLTEDVSRARRDADELSEEYRDIMYELEEALRDRDDCQEALIAATNEMEAAEADAESRATDLAANRICASHYVVAMDMFLR